MPGVVEPCTSFYPPSNRGGRGSFLEDSNTLTNYAMDGKR